MQRSSSLRLTWIPAIVLALALPAQATMLVKQMTLEEITADASRIVHGTVVDVRSARDGEGFPATWITLDVGHGLKGAAAGRLTFKQLGTATPLADGAVTRIGGLPRYAVGEEVVLFLRGESGRGFTSPVGLAQGVFRVRGGTVRSDAPGEKQALDAFLARVAHLAGWGGRR